MADNNSESHSFMDLLFKQGPTDSVLFDLAPNPGILLDSIRGISLGERLVAGTEDYILGRCGLLEDGQLTDAGRALFKLAWVLRKDDEAQRSLGQALRQLTPIQVIEQELRNLGPIPETGVLDLLRQHRAVERSSSEQSIRPTLRWLSAAGVLVYSPKFKTVRTTAQPAESARAGEIQSIASMVSPKTPFLNIVHLRRIIRPLSGIVWWADPHFGTRALEELAEELDLRKVSEIRILSGDHESVVSSRSFDDFKRFRKEMSNSSVAADWHIDGRKTRDWHDRWLADDTVTWNLPPINSLLKNDYSEMSPAVERPPLTDWWDRSKSRQ